MGQIEVLNAFMENPAKDFHIRGIARDLKMPKTTVSYHIQALLKENLIIKEKKGVFPSFRSNEANEMYKFYKKQEAARKIFESGILDYLDAEYNPRCIVLFGSFAKAEYAKGSDIDLFIQADGSEVRLDKYERKLGHKINILFEPDLKRLSPEILNNIINGIKLRGFIKIK